MGSYSFTCHPAEVNISQRLISPAKLYQFADPVRMTGLVGLCFTCVQFAPRALAERWRRHSPPTTVLSFLTVPVPCIVVHDNRPIQIKLAMGHGSVVNVYAYPMGFVDFANKSVECCSSLFLCCLWCAVRQRQRRQH